MKRKCTSAEQALREVAHRDHTTVEEVRKEIRLAMLVGLCNPDLAVQATWKEIPCAGEVPAPEELIDYMVNELQYLINNRPRLS